MSYDHSNTFYMMHGDTDGSSITFVKDHGFWTEYKLRSPTVNIPKDVTTACSERGILLPSSASPSSVSSSSSILRTNEHASATRTFGNVTTNTVNYGIPSVVKNKPPKFTFGVSPGSSNENDNPGATVSSRSHPPTNSSSSSTLSTSIDCTVTYVYGHPSTLADTEIFIISKLNWLTSGSSTLYDRLIGLQATYSSRSNHQIEILQFAIGNRILLLHTASNIFRTEALKKWLKKEWLFVGIDLVGLTLGLAELSLYLHRNLCLTNFLSKLLEEDYPRQLTAPVTLPTDETIQEIRNRIILPQKQGICQIRAIELKKCMNTIFTMNMVREESIAHSTFQYPTLSMSQIKFIAMDAWCIRLLGCVMISATGLTLKPYSLHFSEPSLTGTPNIQYDGTMNTTHNNTVIDKITFSLRGIPVSQHLLLCNLWSEILHLFDTGKREFTVEYKDIRSFVSQPYRLSIRMGAYATRLRNNYPVDVWTVEYSSYQSPRYRKVAIGTTVSLDGRDADIELQKSSLWTAERICHVANEEDNVSILLMTNNFEERSNALEVSMALCKDIVLNCLTVNASQQYRYLEAIFERLGLALPIGILQGTSIQKVQKCLSMNQLSSIMKEAFGKHARQQLNESQQAAVLNSLTHTVSAIRGPPGTGKTRTIATIAQINKETGHRTLITANANSATLRILQSLVDAGYTNVALIVSSEYFNDWHENVYSKELMKYVVTTARGKKKKCNTQNTNDNRSEISEDHECIWYNRPRASPPPDIVILTYGSTMNNAGSEHFTSIGSGGPIQKIVRFDSITRVIVDEASQLWRGYLMYLLSRFRFGMRLEDSNGIAQNTLGESMTTEADRVPLHRVTFTFVGDEKQLPPYGTDGMRTEQSSVFDAVLACSNVPRVLLNTTYRLPLVLTKFLSTTMYHDQLVSVRDGRKDADFETDLAYTLQSRKLESYPLTKALLDRSRRSSSRLNGYSTDAVLWVDANNGKQTKGEGFSRSTCNETEANIVAKLAAGLLVVANVRDGGKNGDSSPTYKMVIISPYEAQRSLIEQKLAREITKDFGSYREARNWVRSSGLVVNIDGFQGQEADLVVISLVRTNGLGFLQDNRRINVLLSRVKQRLFVVGNLRSYMDTASSTSLLNQLAVHCDAIGVVFDPYTLSTVGRTNEGIEGVAAVPIMGNDRRNGEGERGCRRGSVGSRSGSVRSRSASVASSVDSRRERGSVGTQFGNNDGRGRSRDSRATLGSVMDSTLSIGHRDDRSVDTGTKKGSMVTGTTTVNTDPRATVGGKWSTTTTSNRSTVDTHSIEAKKQAESRSMVNNNCSHANIGSSSTVPTDGFASVAGSEKGNVSDGTVNDASSNAMDTKNTYPSTLLPFNPIFVPLLRRFIPERSVIHGGPLAQWLRQEGITVTYLRSDLKEYLNAAGIEEVTENRKVFYRRKEEKSNGMKSPTSVAKPTMSKTGMGSPVAVSGKENTGSMSAVKASRKEVVAKSDGNGTGTIELSSVGKGTKERNSLGNGSVAVVSENSSASKMVASSTSASSSSSSVSTSSAIPTLNCNAKSVKRNFTAIASPTMEAPKKKAAVVINETTVGSNEIPASNVSTAVHPKQIFSPSTLRSPGPLSGTTSSKKGYTPVSSTVLEASLMNLVQETEIVILGSNTESSTLSNTGSKNSNTSLSADDVDIISILRSLVPPAESDSGGKLIIGSVVADGLRKHNVPIQSLRRDIAKYINLANIEEVYQGKALYYRQKKR